MSEETKICWRVHFSSPPAKVYRFLATDDGRARFWAKSAVEESGVIEFRFFNGQSWPSRVIERSPPTRFVVEYVEGSKAAFDLEDDGAGGTDLTLTETDFPPLERMQNYAGWVTVLLTLKAAADFDVDLRNRDASRAWEDGFVDV